jgi:phage baseplate assembly protein W
VADLAVDIIGRGWPFPLRLVAGGGLALHGGEQKIRESIWLILSTAPGERQMRPDFGCSVNDLVFDANTARLRGVVEAKVREALIRWEPRIDVIGVRTETPPEARNHLLILIDYRVRANNAAYNLVYPLFIDEGATG